MQQNPSARPPVKEKKEHPRRAAILKALKGFFLENLGTKLLALFIAIALWAGLISQDPSLTRDKQFIGVPVNVIGSDSLRRNGFIVLEDMNEALADVTMRVSVPQAQYASAQASNYSVRIDLSRVREAGKQELKILSTNSSTYGTVVEIYPSVVMLTVDEYVTRYRIPVTVVTKGEVPEGFYATAPATDPPMIAVSGPRTLVQQIVSAQVVVDQATLPSQEGTVRRALPFNLVDETGAVISSDMLQVTSESVLLDSIIVEQTVYTRREVEMSGLGLVTGQPAEGYEVKGVYISPARVVIAGRASVIEDINMLYADSNVSIDGMKTPINRSLRVRQPSAVKYVSTDMVNVAVEIGPVITSRAYEAQVQLLGLAPALSEAGGLRTATVQLTGPQPWLDVLSSADVTLTCDLAGISEPGTYTLPLMCVIAGSEGQTYTMEITPASVVVTVIQQ